jgi:hypothetical protein
VTDAFRPFACLLVLGLPYLPWLGDALPGLDVLAGPFKYLWWSISLVLICRALWQGSAGRRRRPSLSRRAKTAVVCGVSIAVFALAAARLTRTALFPGGDEPHYLVIAQSLWRDGDLRIQNNHQRGDTLEYYATDLEPHYLTRGVDREIYSVHPVGLPIIAAPVYAFGGYAAVVTLILTLAALAVTVTWRIALQVTGSPAAATFGWLAASFTAPFLFNSFAVYPEIPASLASAFAYGLATGAIGRPLRAPRWWACGTAIAVLPWLSTKYVFLAGALGATALARVWWPVAGSPSRDDQNEPVPEAPTTFRSRLHATMGVIVPCVISLSAWFAFFWIIWGTPSPSAPYGSFRGTRLQHLRSGAPGLLFDQEYGVVFAAPVLWLALSGLAGMLRDRTARRIGVEIAACFIGLFALVGAFELWWGGSAMVGRPLAAALPLLCVPIAWQFARRAGAPALRAGYAALLASSLVIAIAMGTISEGALLAAQGNGRSRLLEWASPTWNLVAAAPTFIAQPPGPGLVVAAVWVFVACAAGAALRRARHRGPGRAGAQALGTIGIALLIGVLGATGLREPPVPGPPRLEARAYSRLLHTYSPSRRPIAVRYDPLQVVDPSTLPPLFRLVARADDRRPGTPVALLHNARWSLPPGRYGVQLQTSPGGDAGVIGTLGLQLGRLGEPVQRWAVSPDSDGRWSSTFELPLHIGSVGFTADAALERLSPVLVLRPEHVRDTRLVPSPTQVLQAARYGDLRVFFHDASTHPEPEGFWTNGRAITRVTMTGRDGLPPLVRLRAGPLATRVVITGAVDEALALEPHASREVRLPSNPGAAWPLEIRSSASFVPADVDPQSRDRRDLGVWVEF